MIKDLISPYIFDENIMPQSRRHFILQTITGAGALAGFALQNTAHAQASAAVAETDPQAIALGYVTDSAKVDAKKHANYLPAQNCAGCALYQVKEANKTGSCAVFGDKLVAGKGWCAAWTKRA